MRLLNDWVCDTPNCKQNEIEVEHLLEREKVPVCEVCGEPMRKAIKGLKSTHVSWSSWRVV